MSTTGLVVSVRGLLSASLGRRFSLAAGAVALALASLSAGVSFVLAYRDAERDAAQTLAGLADAVKNTAAVGAYAKDTVLLDEVAKGLVRHPMVGEVRITLIDGPTVTQRRAGAQTASADTPRLQLDLASPFDAQETLGQIQVQAEPGALALGAQRQALRASLPMFLQVLLLTGLLSALAARLLSRPMARLAEQVAAIEPGSAQVLEVPQRHQRDEIGRLVRRINELLQATTTALDRERELRAEVSAIEGQLRRLLDASSAAIFLLDAEGRLLQGNATLVRLGAGSAEAALTPAGFIEQLFAQPEALHALRRSALEQGWPLSADLRLRRLATDGGECWVHVLLSPLAGDDGHPLVEGVLYDVTQRRREEQRARHQAQHDALTGLRNRAGLLAELDRAVAALQAGGKGALTLLYLDLDGFKAVNDARGHEAGDVVLREVAVRLSREARRGSDTVARLGGDEFVLLLQADADEPWVRELAWRLTRVLAHPIPLPDGGAPALIGASVGLAGLPQHAADRDSLLRAADQAMYQVKHATKNGVATPDGPLPGNKNP
jgi:diguanylate cyclase (GGDEF)-like protein/PAS domain S-box-containing protein